jgi:hypothetical protein
MFDIRYGCTKDIGVISIVAAELKFDGIQRKIS